MSGHTFFPVRRQEDKGKKEEMLQISVKIQKGSQIQVVIVSLCHFCPIQHFYKDF